MPQRISYACARGMLGLYRRSSISAAKISEMVRMRTMSDMFEAQSASGYPLPSRIFMMMSDRVQNFRGDAAGPFQRVVSGRRMRFDDGSLPGIQTSRFVENGDWNFALPMS